MRVRLLVAVSVMLTLIACGGSAAGGESPTTPKPTSTTPSSPEAGSGPLVGLGEVEDVDSSFQLLDPEGPQWMPDEGVLLFSDVSANTIYQVAADDEITMFRMPSNDSNGLAVDPQGRLITAESGTRRVTRTESDGSVTPIAERFEGARLNEPNDIAVRSDGTIYFTDPAFEIAAASVELDFRGVFRIAPDGVLTVERRGDSNEAPNGVALSPDESRLYVTDTFANLVRVFDVAADGSLSKARKFLTVAGPDGMAVDQAGNLFVASYRDGVIEVFDPDGGHWGTIDVPGSPTNCAFGGADGRTLYITSSGWGLLRVTLANPGIY